MADGGKLSLSKFTFGVHQGSQVETQGMLLKDYKGLTLPPPSYFSYEPLPETWEKILDRVDVVNPQIPTEEMAEFEAQPVFKRESMVEASGSMTNFQKLGLPPHLKEYPEQAKSYESMSGEGSIEQEDNEHLDSEMRASSHERVKWRSMEQVKASGSKHPKNHKPISEHYDEVSEKLVKTERGTEADDQETQIRASGFYDRVSSYGDQLLMDELEAYNPKLNREVSRILNDH